MNIHPLCAILPAMPASDYKMLVDDIRAKGLMRPITVFEGMILDGRHRFQACNDANVKPRFEEYPGTDPQGFVASSCVHRSLSTSQRALIAAGFLAYEKEQARTRMLAGKHPPATLPEGSEKGDARDIAGARMHVSGNTVSRAAVVLANAPAEIIEQVRAGNLTVNTVVRNMKNEGSVTHTRVNKSASVRKKELEGLLNTGRNPEQIAEAMGLTLGGLKNVAKKHGLALPNEVVRGRRIDYRRIIEHTITGLEASAAALSTVPVSLDEFTAAETREWAKSVTESIQAFTAFSNQLRSHANA